MPKKKTYQQNYMPEITEEAASSPYIQRAAANARRRILLKEKPAWLAIPATETTPPDTLRFEDESKKIGFLLDQKKLNEPPKDESSEAERAMNRLYTGTSYYPSADSVLAKLKPAPSAPKQLEPDKQWAVNKAKNRYAILLSKNELSPAEQKEFDRLSKSPMIVGSSKEPISPEDVAWKTLGTTTEELGKTVYDPETGEWEYEAQGGTRGAYESKQKETTNQLLNIELGKLTGSKTPEEGRQHYETGKMEALNVLKQYKTGQIQASKQQVVDQLNKIAQSHGFQDYAQLKAYSQRIANAK